MNDPEARLKRAGSAGREWAAAVQSSLHQEGRHALGGWPGTLSEARTRVASAIGGGAKVSADERRKLVRILYDTAKSTWLATRETTQPDA